MAQTGKDIVILFNGTWATSDADHPSNVILFKRALDLKREGGVSVYYDDGVGTDSNPNALVQQFDKVMSGMFGIGLLAKVRRAYRFLCDNYTPGDRIYTVGFSRGGFEARTLIGLVRMCGILPNSSGKKIEEAIKLYQTRKPDSHPDSEELLAFRAVYSPEVYMSDAELAWRTTHNAPGVNLAKPLNVDYIGVWDTVGSLGVPDHLWGLTTIFNKNSSFHDTDLSLIVKFARHAVAIDERRKSFTPALWSNLDKRNIQNGSDPESLQAPYQQMWFPGEHTAVGGGTPTTGLSNNALLWIIEGAQQAGLAFQDDVLAALRARVDYRARLFEADDHGLAYSVLSKQDREGPDNLPEVNALACKRWLAEADEFPDRELYRPAALKKVASVIEGLRKPL